MSNLKLTNCPYCDESGDLHFQISSTGYYRCFDCDLIYSDVQKSYRDVVGSYREDYFDRYSADQLDERRDRRTWEPAVAFFWSLPKRDNGK
jgi:hypothetical protein